MASYALYNFHEAVRALVGDEGEAATGYDFVGAQLDSALRTVVRMGHVSCLSLECGNPDSLVAEPLNPDTWGMLAAQAALILVGGKQPESIRTRALSVMVDPAAKRDALSWIETMISNIDARGNVCGTADDTGHRGLFGTVGDVVTWCRVGGPCGESVYL